MLAKLCTDVQAETKVPVSKGLRKAFAEQGYTIPVLVGNPDDCSGSVSNEDLKEMFDAVAAADKKDKA